MTSAAQGANHDRLVDDWLAGLHGSTGISSMSPAVRVGLLLRALVSQHLADQAPEDAEFDDALIRRWRAQGMLDGRRSQGAHGGWAALAGKLRQLRRRVLLPVLIGLALLLVVPWPTLFAPEGSIGDSPELPASRGEQAAQVLTVDDPAQLAERIAAVLARRQLALRRVVLAPQVVQLQAMLPAHDSALQQDLRQLGVDWPANGRLDVLLRRPR